MCPHPSPSLPSEEGRVHGERAGETGGRLTCRVPPGPLALHGGSDREILPDPPPRLGASPVIPSQQTSPNPSPLWSRSFIAVGRPTLVSSVREVPYADLRTPGDRRSRPRGRKGMCIRGQNSVVSGSHTGLRTGSRSAPSTTTCPPIVHYRLKWVSSRSRPYYYPTFRVPGPSSTFETTNTRHTGTRSVS